MKILIINTVPTSRNGITNVIFNYLRAMDKKNVSIDMVSINQPDELYKEQIENCGGRIYVLPRTGKRILQYWCRLKNLVRANHYDIVHIHGNSHTTVLDLLATRIAGCGVGIVHAHTTTCDHVVVHHFLTPIFNLLCTHRLACGEKAGKFMFGTKPFLVIKNGVDIKRFSFDEEKRHVMRNQLGWGVDQKVIGHVGYFLPVKNHSFIVDIFSQIYKKDNKYRLLLIGDGELKQKIEKKLISEGLADAVCMTGNVDNVEDYLNAMDLIVMPSLYEGLPLSLMEQQANGLPCVISDTITREVDKTGNIKFLSLSLSPDVWANNIMSMNLAQSRKERSENAVEQIKYAGYSINAEAEKLKEIYESSL